MKQIKKAWFEIVEPEFISHFYLQTSPFRLEVEIPQYYYTFATKGPSIPNDLPRGF